MARTSNIFARVEPEIKEQAEQVLSQLGIPMSSAVDMFLHQIIIHKGIPFEVKLPQNKPLCYQSMTKEEFDAQMENSIKCIEEGKVYSAEYIEEEMKRDFGL